MPNPRAAVRTGGTHSSFTSVPAVAAPVQQDPRCPLSPCMRHSLSLKPIGLGLERLWSARSPHPHPAGTF